MHSRNEKGETILHQVARNSNNPDDINILVQASADINAKDKHGNTPLHFAAWFNKNSKIITTLIKAGANIHAVFFNLLSVIITTIKLVLVIHSFILL